MTSRLESQAKSPFRLFYARYRDPGPLAELSDDTNLTTLHAKVHHWAFLQRLRVPWPSRESELPAINRIYASFCERVADVRMSRSLGFSLTLSTAASVHHGGIVGVVERR